MERVCLTLDSSDTVNSLTYRRLITMLSSLVGLFKPKLTKERFAKRFAAKMKTVPEFTQIDVDLDKFLIRYRGNSDSTSTAYLDNAYRDALGDLSSVERVIDRYVKSTIETQNFPQLKDNLAGLRPTVRPSNVIGLYALAMEQPIITSLPTLPSLHLAGPFSVSLVVDSEHSIQSVSFDHLEKANLTFDSALELAIGNLRASTTPCFRKLSPGYYVSAWQDIYDATRLLLPEMLFQLELRGDPVVSIPSRNWLLVAGSKDEQALASLCKGTNEISTTDTRPYTPTLLTYVDGRWQTFDEPYADRHLIDTTAYRHEAQEYKQQKENLEDIFRKTERDVFVASYQLLEDAKNKNLFSLTQWTQGVETLLAETDRLLLFIPEPKELLIASFSKIRALCPDSFEQLGGHPVRYQTRRFPSEAELASIREFAIEINN